MSDKELKKQGIVAHDEKEGVVGEKNVSRYDIYKEKSTGDLYVAQKGLPRGSELQPLNLRIDKSGKMYEVSPGVKIPDDIIELPFEFPDLPL